MGRDRLRHHLRDHHTSRQRGLADILGGARLAATSRLHRTGVVHPPERISRLASTLDGLVRSVVEVRRRDAVHAVDVGACRRFWGAVAVVATRAGVSGVRDLAVASRLMVGMGNPRPLRAQVTA